MVLPTDAQMVYAKSLQTPKKPESNKLIQNTLSALSLIPHPEGGYFAETDRDALLVPNPFLGTKVYEHATIKPPTTNDPTNSSTANGTDQTQTRNASTTIFYFLDPNSPTGIFHRNKGRTIHTHHRGRGVYVLVHADESSKTPGPKARIETFTVGPDILAGEKLQWIVEGGKFKASFLLPDRNSDESQGGLLISETVVPGFEYADHDFLTLEGMRELLTEEDYRRLSWLLRREERDKI